MPPKTCRGQILDFLNGIYDKYASEMSIISVFYEYYKDTEIRRALRFMSTKGYLECKVVKHPVKRGVQENHYRITPAGIEILEGIKDDPAILLEADHQESE